MRMLLEETGSCCSRISEKISQIPFLGERSPLIGQWKKGKKLYLSYFLFSFVILSYLMISWSILLKFEGDFGFSPSHPRTTHVLFNVHVHSTVSSKTYRAIRFTNHRYDSSSWVTNRTLWDTGSSGNSSTYSNESTQSNRPTQSN